MAYLKDLSCFCMFPTCKRFATHQVYHGNGKKEHKYCPTHARYTVAMLSKQEREKKEHSQAGQRNSSETTRTSR
jgi:ribosomal protein L44E